MTSVLAHLRPAGTGCTPTVGGGHDGAHRRPVEDHADPTTPYMFHYHVLRHEDQGMMGQFVVVEQGRAAVEQGQAAQLPAHQHP